MDFLLADRFHIRPGEEPDYAEKILRLPHGYACFLPPAEAPDSGPLPASRLVMSRWVASITLPSFRREFLMPGPMPSSLAHRQTPDRGIRDLSQPEFCDRLHVHFATHGIPPQNLLARAAHRTRI